LERSTYNAELFFRKNHLWMSRSILNLQFSYFKDENYDYLTIIHQTKDKEEIHNLMKSINHKVFEYDIQIL